VKLIAFALFFLPLASEAEEQSHDAIVRLLLNAKSFAMRGGASAVDIDKVLEFYTDDVVYEDPKVKIRIEGKDRIRSGMLSHTGDYAGEARISVDQSVSLANAVAAVITEVFFVNGPDGRKEIQRKRLQVIEFRGEKICRVIDYN
jgi:ketosteroid isomerase-like protein